MNTKSSKIIFPTVIALFTLALLGGIFYFASKAPWVELPKDDSINNSATGEHTYNFDYSWADKHPLIAHAFGGILGDSYTNSYEAFLLNYQLGHRVFEVDFAITDDGKTVAAHDAEVWKNSATIRPDSDLLSKITTDNFTYDNFMSSLWYNKYHTVDLNILFELMKEHPDIYIVTDTKYADEEHVKQQFSAFLETAKQMDSSLLDRFVVQIYHPEMLNWVMDVYPWKSIIYTLYNDPNWTPENVLEFSEKSGVKFITMWGSWATKEISDLWKTTDIKIGVHTINDYSEVKRLLSLGVNNFYTDFLLPETIETK